MAAERGETVGSMMRAGRGEEERAEDRPRRSHESLIATAMLLLGEQAKADKIALLAMLLQEEHKEKELALKDNERELALKDKELEIQLVMKEKEMVINNKELEMQLAINNAVNNKELEMQLAINNAVNNKELEMQLVIRDKDMAHAIQMNKFKRQLSYVTRRYLLEKLFFEVFSLVDSQDLLAQQALAKLSTSQRKRFKPKSMSMTELNRLLLANDDLRIAAWKYMGLPQDLRLPHFDESPELLYGILSEAMHSSNGAYVYISDQAPAVEAEFFKNLARVFRKELEIYNQDLAEHAIQEEGVQARVADASA